MKIIQPGNHDIPKEYQRSCGKCTTKFAFIDPDIKFDRDGAYVNCPVCGAFISVGSDNNTTHR